MRIVTGVTPEPLTPAQVSRRFRALVQGGARLLPVGRAKHEPEQLLTPRYLPHHEIRLLKEFYLPLNRESFQHDFFEPHLLQLTQQRFLVHDAPPRASLS